jgi:hypothetical protein
MASLPYRQHLGPLFSEGARRLWLVPTARAQLCLELGLHSSVLIRLLYGDTRPRLETALVLADKCAIPVGDWTRAPAAAFVLPAVVRRRKRLAQARRLARKKAKTP